MLCPHLSNTSTNFRNIKKELTYLKRKDAGRVIDIHCIVNSMYVWIKITGEPSVQWVTLRSECGRIVGFGERHVVRTGITIFLSVPSFMYYKITKILDTYGPSSYVSVGIEMYSLLNFTVQSVSAASA